MSIDTAFQRLRDANPVPDPAALREPAVEENVFLAATQRRSKDMTTEHEPLTTPKPTPPWRKWRPALAAFVVVIVVGGSIALWAGGSDTEVTGTASVTDPASVLEAYVDAYNARDLDGVVALFAEDAVVTDHPLDEEGSIATGVVEIRLLEERDMVLSREENAYEMTDIEATGNTVSFGHIIHHKSGRCFAGTGHSLVVEDSKIVRWDWGTPRPCP